MKIELVVGPDGGLLFCTRSFWGLPLRVELDLEEPIDVVVSQNPRGIEEASLPVGVDAKLCDTSTEDDIETGYWDIRDLQFRTNAGSVVPLKNFLPCPDSSDYGETILELSVRDDNSIFIRTDIIHGIPQRMPSGAFATALLGGILIILVGGLLLN